LSNGDNLDIFEQSLNNPCLSDILNREKPEFFGIESEETDNIYTYDDLKELKVKRRLLGFFNFLENSL